MEYEGEGEGQTADQYFLSRVNYTILTLLLVYTVSALSLSLSQVMGNFPNKNKQIIVND